MQSRGTIGQAYVNIRKQHVSKVGVLFLFGGSYSKYITSLHLHLSYMHVANEFSTEIVFNSLGCKSQAFKESKIVSCTWVQAVQAG